MKVSLIIPTSMDLERQRSIERLLLSIKEQVLDNYTLEIIIVNNSIRYVDIKWIEFLIEDQKPTIISENTIGLSKARNTGIKYASGDIIIFLDDDVWVDKNYINQIVEAFNITDAICVGGQVLIESGEYPSWVTNYFTRFILPPSYPRELSPIIKPYYIIGASMAFRKEVFSLYGVFDETLGRVGKKLLSGEDIEIVKRFPKDNVYICPTAIVRTSIGIDRLKRSYYIKRLFWQGVTDAILLYKHPHIEFYDLNEISFKNGLPNFFYYKISKLMFFEALCVLIRYFGFILQKTRIKWRNIAWKQ